MTFFEQVKFVAQQHSDNENKQLEEDVKNLILSRIKKRPGMKAVYLPSKMSTKHISSYLKKEGFSVTVEYDELECENYFAVSGW